MSLNKILTVTIEFDMGDRKISTKRVKDVHEKATTAAIEAAKAALLEGSISTVRSNMKWGYQFAQADAVYEIDTEEEDEGWDESPGTSDA